MFCIPCQKKFGTRNAYKSHAATPSHAEAEEQYKRNKGAHMTRNTENFIADLHSYISQLAEYKEIGQMYREYLARNRLRIQGTHLKSIEEAIDRISAKISVVREGGRVMVRRLSRFKAVRKPVAFDRARLGLPFPIRTVQACQPPRTCSTAEDAG